jgi:membrane protease YdiL (CAAX protease family)
MAALGFIALMLALWVVAVYFDIAGKLGDHLPSAVLSLALLVGPYWAFGFGLAGWLDRRLNNALARLAAPVALVISYVVFAVPRGEFRWNMAVALAAAVLAVQLMLAHAVPRSKPDWHDWLVLLFLALTVELHPFDRAWAAPGLSAMPKLLLLDAALYGFLVIRRLDGVGFDFRAHWADFRIGLREFLYYTPVALALGFLMGFLHLHRVLSNPLWFGSGWIFTLFFIAVPEELFFRGLLLNMLEIHFGTRRALVITSILFGLAHFNKRTAFFNWRYVILAAIAGFFYGRAWLSERRILTSSITHATVDTVWSIWLR